MNATTAAIYGKHQRESLAGHQGQWGKRGWSVFGRPGRHQFEAEITGLAVQRNPGRLLFVVHAFLNQLRVFYKRTGQSVCNVSLPAPGRVALSADGGARWVLQNSARVAKYATDTLCGPVQPPVPALIVASALLTSPLALSVSPTTGVVAVADNATSQVKLFEPQTEGLVGTIGMAGGYRDGNATVDAAKFA